jgi:hypothetical protein
MGLATHGVGAPAWEERGAGDREVAGSNPANGLARSCGLGCLRNPIGRWLGVASDVCGIPLYGWLACGGGVKRIDASFEVHPLVNRIHTHTCAWLRRPWVSSGWTGLPTS